MIETARAAIVDLEAFGHDMRRLMNLSPVQKTTKKFLRETMTMNEYDIARKGYGEKLRVLLDEDVPNHEPPSEAGEASTPAAVPAAVDVPAALPATGESGPSVPFGSSSAPGPDADAAREKLRGEAIAWGIPAAEIPHILAP